ncbi:hypothetical protein DIS24_g2535 [Lasiodiplodia hormozganensis]|uniref:Response regulatory domain-containing protein n=1 Tax=Lasiodiplodia hormozganensis TaxID=869390 RepID=A0AA40D4K2_9PEZI|nr:hypothetical protein DIS24_g2535 [Lasiodiplodia hormozganensis]
MTPPSGPAAHGDPGSSSTSTTTTAAASTTISAPPKQPSKTDIALRPFMADPAKVEARKSLVVLVVEDNMVNQKLARILLSKLCYQVQIVKHGKACLEYLERTALWRGPAPQAAEGGGGAVGAGGSTGGAATGQGGDGGGNDEEAEELPTPAIILLDISMPIMGGYETMGKIKEWEREGWLVRRVPIVLMSAHVIGGDDYLRQKKEADDLIRKPLRGVELAEKVDGWVEKFGYDGRNGVDVGEFTRMRIGVSCE